MSKPLIGLMLYNIVLTNQQICSILDERHKLSLRFPLPDSSGDLRHQHHHLRQGRLFRLYSETELFTKRPQATSKKFSYRIAAPDERSCLNKSHKIIVFWATRRGNFRQIVQFHHFLAQRIGSFASRIGCLPRRHPVVEPIAILAASPFIPHSGGEPHAIPKLGQMKSYAAKLRSEGSLRPF
jgi:hypothetical protein